ncbi:MAG: hypothetical protein ACFFBD_23500 [Candidatus Hodarchaeota archaeon]
MNIYKIVLSFILAAFLAIAGYFVYRRDPSEMLNLLFLGAFEAYTVFFIFDAFIGIMYSDLVLANLCRDISSVSALFGHSLVFLGSYYVLKGKDALKEPKIIIPFLLLTGIAIILGQLDDWVVVDITTQSYTLEQNILGILFNFIYHAILILSAIGIYTNIYLSSTDEDIKRRLKLLVLGLGTVVIGQLFQVILAALITPAVYYALILPDAIVYSLWAIGIIVIIRAFQR